MRGVKGAAGVTSSCTSGPVPSDTHVTRRPRDGCRGLGGAAGCKQPPRTRQWAEMQNSLADTLPEIRWRHWHLKGDWAGLLEGPLRPEDKNGRLSWAALVVQW